MTISVLLTHFLFALLLMLLSWGISWWMLHRVAILDIPNERSSHEEPTPRGGGVAIVLTFMVGVVAIFLIADTAYIARQYFWGFLVATLTMAGISLYDDLKSYSYRIKLFTHVLAVVLVLLAGIVIDKAAIPLFGVVELGGLGYLASFIWLLGLSNAYNFMDGIDGLSASTAMIVSAFFCWITFHEGSLFIYIVSYTVFSGAAGFLFWNRPPARIFMGDVGSVFLGFVFACMAIIADRYDVSHTSVMVMPLLLLHFIFDTVVTMGRRFLAGENIMLPHRTHIYQLLIRMGMSHRMVTGWYCLLAILQGIAAIVMIEMEGNARLLIFVQFVFLYAILAYIIIAKARKRGLLGTSA